MKCEDLMRFLNDYIDGEVDLSVCEEFEKHIEECNPCRVVIDNLKKTITLYKGEEIYEMPDKLHSKLHSSLKDKWDELKKQQEE